MLRSGYECCPAALLIRGVFKQEHLDWYSVTADMYKSGEALKYIWQTLLTDTEAKQSCLTKIFLNFLTLISSKFMSGKPKHRVNSLLSFVRSCTVHVMCAFVWLVQSGSRCQTSQCHRLVCSCNTEFLAVFLCASLSSQVERTRCATKTLSCACKLVRRLNTEVSLTIRTVSCQTLITKILEMMDGSPKCGSVIMKCEQYLMCQDKWSLGVLMVFWSRFQFSIQLDVITSEKKVKC